MSRNARVSCYFFAACICFVINIHANANQSELQVDALLEPRWSDNFRYSIDGSYRAINDKQGDFGISVLGFDAHKVFSSRNRDIATIMFQPYLVYFSERERAPFFFDQEKTELTWRIVNINWHLVPSKSFNFRLGHFEVPFGLEQNIDTNGTLRQYSFSQRGIKADWGFSVNGVHQNTEYEFALTRGSGNEIIDTGNPYIAAGRVGWQRGNSTVGVSVFDGAVLGPLSTTNHQHLGLDYTYYMYSFEFLSEVSVGEIAGDSAYLALIEFGWKNSVETLHLYTQYKDESIDQQERVKRSQWVLGVEFFPARGWDLSAQAYTQLRNNPSTEKGYAFSLQVRYRL